MIDQDNLQFKINSLNSLKVELSDKRHRVLEVLESLKYIREEDIIDRDTNLPMTEARRQEIYDACIAAADDLLGLNEPPEDNT